MYVLMLRWIYLYLFILQWRLKCACVNIWIKVNVFYWCLIKIKYYVQCMETAADDSSLKNNTGGALYWSSFLLFALYLQYVQSYSEKKSVAIKITFHNLYDQNKLNTKENCLPAHMDPGRYVSSLIWHRVNKRCESGPALSDHRLVQNSDLTWLCLLGFNNTRLHWTRLKTLNLQTSVRNAPERGPYTAAASL